MATPALGRTLEQRAAERFAGRDRELALLGACFEPGAARVYHVSGVPGIGKSHLVRAFAARARAGGAAVVLLDCRAIEPSEPGLLGGLASATGARKATLPAVAARLNGLAETVILALDTYELFWLMDTYIRRVLCPALQDNVRVVLAGRNGPVGAWLAAPEWAGLFRALQLGPLSRRESVDYLQAAGLDSTSARLVAEIARGHPLALSVASGIAAGQRGKPLEDAAKGAVIDHLTNALLVSALDASTVKALEAASVVRRITESLLAAMLPESAPSDVLERLRQLSFVETRSDGVFVHDAVRDAVSLRLEAEDPERHRRYRVAAWRQLQGEVRDAPRSSLWRYTADILYLLRQPVIREAFFPTGYQPLAVEAALPDDYAAVQAIASAHEGPEAAEVVEQWWRWHPQEFNVCRDAEGSTIGFNIVIQGSRLSREIVAADPIAAVWREDMRNAASRSLLVRRQLDRDASEGDSFSRAAFGLSVKRTYMEMRPRLRYIYLAGLEPENFVWCGAVGFRPLPEAARNLDGRTYHSYRLDMGPGSVDAWLAGLVRDELGVSGEAGLDILFDADSRELVLPSGRVDLTPLEAGVMQALTDRAGRPVSRAELLERVWGYGADTSSNVVDAMVLTLRKKLGPRAPELETVRGVGYRLRAARH